MERNMINIGCTGCLKIEPEFGVNCVAYAYPGAQFRLGECALKSNKVLEVKGSKKVNPIKASKRGGR